MSMISKGCLAAGLLAGALLTGCAHKPTVVGTWNGTTTTAQGGTLKTTLQLTEDGKETMTASTSGGPLSLTMTGSGTYTVDGSNLTQNITSFTGSMNGKTIPIPPPAAKSDVAQYKLDGDKLTLTKSGNPSAMVFTRQAQ